jgi:hypothetical protein
VLLVLGEMVVFREEDYGEWVAAEGFGGEDIEGDEG